MSTEDIFFIIGEAGTAKTTKLMATAQSLLDKQISFVCLAFTHSAVSNMYQTLMELTKTKPDKKLFRTIHSYFKIVPSETIHSYNNYRIDPDYMLIDEISLIPLELVNMIFNTTSSKLILAGDLLQLNPISDRQPINIELFHQRVLPTYDVDMYSSLLIASHLSNNIYSTDQYYTCKKLLLSENFRSNSSVSKILNTLLRFNPGDSDEMILNNLSSINILSLNSTELQEYVTSSSPVFIASQYKYLSKIYETFSNPLDYEYSFKTKLGLTYYKQGTKFMLTKNITREIHNGDILTMDGENKFVYKDRIVELEKDEDEDVYPLLPLNYISIHKAQGRGYKNVVVILDEMFEVTMLYTAVTRARESIQFVLLDNDLSKFHANYIRTVKAFNLLKNIIYGMN